MLALWSYYQDTLVNLVDGLSCSGPCLWQQGGRLEYFCDSVGWGLYVSSVHLLWYFLAAYAQLSFFFCVVSQQIWVLFEDGQVIVFLKLNKHTKRSSCLLNIPIGGSGFITLTVYKHLENDGRTMASGLTPMASSRSNP